ncbi:hypothetical protein C8J56DRAFT_275612 [Mycena floridula]|nr:hypothetical protein C8J56DRAFT_275612 [Mycena floridula]
MNEISRLIIFANHHEHDLHRKPYSPWVAIPFSLTIPTPEALEFHTRACQSPRFSDAKVERFFDDCCPLFKPAASDGFHLHVIIHVLGQLRFCHVIPFSLWLPPISPFLPSKFLEEQAILEARRPSSAKRLKDFPCSRLSYEDLFTEQNSVLLTVRETRSFYSAESFGIAPAGGGYSSSKTANVHCGRRYQTLCYSGCPVDKTSIL